MKNFFSIQRDELKFNQFRIIDVEISYLPVEESENKPFDEEICVKEYLI